MLLKKYNLALLIIPLMIFSLGIMTLVSISPDRAQSQIIFFVIGILAYLGISSLDYTIFKYYWKILYGIILVLLILTYVLGVVVFGSSRWLDIGAFNFQPSEFAKVVVILSLSALLATTTNINNYKLLAKTVILIVPIAALVLLQPDLGTSLVIIGIYVVTMFYVGVSKMYFLLALIIASIFSTPAWNFLHQYQKERILIFLNPTLDVLGSGYNVIQSLIAVGSGGLLGRGFGRGTQSHLQFLPAYWTDFIFASFAEEWGFVGVLILLCLFLALFLTFIYILSKITDTFGLLVIVGVFTVIFMQFTINVGMNLGIMPVTGIPLPLFSYGGSSLISNFVLLGLAQSVWVYNNK